MQHGLSGIEPFTPFCSVFLFGRHRLRSFALCFILFIYINFEKGGLALGWHHGQFGSLRHGD
jgi:hypothetical protein